MILELRSTRARALMAVSSVGHGLGVECAAAIRRLTTAGRRAGRQVRACTYVH